MSECRSERRWLDCFETENTVRKANENEGKIITDVYGFFAGSGETPYSEAETQLAEQKQKIHCFPSNRIRPLS